LIAEIKRAENAVASFRQEAPREIGMALYFGESHQLTTLGTKFGIEEELTADDMRTAYQTLCCTLDSLRDNGGISNS
jgi:hypothetical protein